MDNSIQFTFLPAIADWVDCGILVGPSAGSLGGRRGSRLAQAFHGSRCCQRTGMIDEMGVLGREARCGGQSGTQSFGG